MPACRIHFQFPLHNAFALTAHKTQAITLPETSLYLNNQMFAPGQAYVAISICQSWEDIQILSLTANAFLVDERVKKNMIDWNKYQVKYYPFIKINSTM